MKSGISFNWGLRRSQATRYSCWSRYLLPFRNHRVKYPISSVLGGALSYQYATHPHCDVNWCLEIAFSANHRWMPHSISNRSSDKSSDTVHVSYLSGSAARSLSHWVLDSGSLDRHAYPSPIPRFHSQHPVVDPSPDEDAGEAISVVVQSATKGAQYRVQSPRVAFTCEDPDPSR